MKKISEGPLDTLATNIKGGAARYRDAALGGNGQASERLSLRVIADDYMNAWLKWMTRQRYGNRQANGDANDLRKFVKQYFGDQVLQQIEPTITQIAGGPVQQPAQPAPAAGTAPAAPAPHTDFDANDDGVTIPPVPGGNPEVPPYLQKQRNAPGEYDRNAVPRKAPIVPATDARRNTNQPPPRPIPRFGQRQNVAAEAARIRGTLVEAALQRSQLDMVMQQLAAIQKDAGVVSTSNQTTQQQPRGRQGNAQNQEPQGNQRSNANVPQMLNSPITLRGMEGAMRKVNMSREDEAAIMKILQSNGDNMTMNALLSALPKVSGATFGAILFAMANG